MNNQKKLSILLLVPLILLSLLFSICIVHQAQYSSPDYVCTHMCRDIEDFLENFGLDVLLVRGSTSDNTAGYIWVKIGDIELDSVWLLPLPNRQRYPSCQMQFSDYSEYIEWKNDVQIKRINI